jgi:hypothetical protein
VGVCCAEVAFGCVYGVAEGDVVDGMVWADGAGAVVLGAGAAVEGEAPVDGYWVVVGVCAQAGAAIARRIAKLVPLKRCFMVPSPEIATPTGRGRTCG